MIGILVGFVIGGVIGVVTGVIGVMIVLRLIQKEFWWKMKRSSSLPQSPIPPILGKNS